MSIQDTYTNKIKQKSDINEHLPTLLKYGNQVDHITEFGVRWGGSTWAFLLSKPVKIVSYDIKKTNPVDGIIQSAKAENIDFVFIENDTLNVSIEKTDLLFIDTLHTYAQLISELELHHKQVSKYIILHDTTTYGTIDMKYNGPMSSRIADIAKKYPNKKGLMTAVEDFIHNHKEWYILETFANNNGLTILAKNE